MPTKRSNADMNKDVDDAPDRLSGEHCVIVSIPLTERMGTKGERQWCLALEDRIEEALKISASGFVDGDEWGEFEWKLFVYGRRAAKIWDSIKPVLLKARCPKGSFATRRHGDAITAKEVSVPLSGPNAGAEPEPIVLKNARKPGAPDDPQPGDVFAVPLESGGVGTLIVSRSAEARHAHAYAFCYLLDTRFDHQPEPREFKDSKPTDACLVGFVLKTILRSKRCAWLGRLPGFSLDNWPMPPSLEHYEFRPDNVTGYALHTFDEATMPRVIHSKPAKAVDAAMFPQEIEDYEYLSRLSSQWHRALRGVLKSHRSDSINRLNATPDMIRAWWKHEQSHAKPPKDTPFTKPSAKPLLPCAGDLWTEPLQGGGFALVLLAQLNTEYRYGHAHGTVYAFRRHFTSLPTPKDAADLSPTETVLVAIISLGKHHPERATYLGPLPNYTPGEWPIPPVLTRDHAMMRPHVNCDSAHDEPYLHIPPPFSMDSDEDTVMRHPKKNEIVRWQEFRADNGLHLGSHVGYCIDLALRHDDPLYRITITPTTHDLWRSLWKELKPKRSKGK